MNYHLNLQIKNLLIQICAPSCTWLINSPAGPPGWLRGCGRSNKHCCWATEGVCIHIHPRPFCQHIIWNKHSCWASEGVCCTHIDTWPSFWYYGVCLRIHTIYPHARTQINISKIYSGCNNILDVYKYQGAVYVLVDRPTQLICI